VKRVFNLHFFARRLAMMIAKPSRTIAGWSLAFALCLSGCRHEPNVVPPPPLEVMISQPIKSNIEDWDLYTGTIEAKESINVQSRVRGKIEQVLFTEGTEVAAGTKLVLIDSQPFEADLAVAKGLLRSAKAKLLAAEDKLAMYKKLTAQASLSREDLVEATGKQGEALGEVATAEGKIAEAELNIKYCTITADISGKVGQALQTKGNMVNPGSGKDNILTTIVSVDPMFVTFHVNERALLRYRDQWSAKLMKLQKAKDSQLQKNGNSPEIPVMIGLGTLPWSSIVMMTPGEPDIPVLMGLGAADEGFPYKGVVSFVDNRVDPGTGSMKVKARFDNPKNAAGIRPLTVGLFARIRISIADPQPAILVSDRAILTDQNLKYVLVVDKDKKVKRVDIVASDRVQDNGLRAITAGLKGDEWIIVEGVNRTRPEATVAPKEGTMPHRPEKK
jgi:membrane fusion protein, multidrug efflux system